MRKAQKIRGKCDCFAPLKRYASIVDGEIVESAVYCPKCRQFMRRVRAMDAESFIDCQDPKARGR